MGRDDNPVDKAVPLPRVLMLRRLPPALAPRPAAPSVAPAASRTAPAAPPPVRQPTPSAYGDLFGNANEAGLTAGTSGAARRDR